MSNKEELMQEIVESDYKPVYQKPKTSLFLIMADEIQSGANNIVGEEFKTTKTIN